MFKKIYSDVYELGLEPLPSLSVLPSKEWWLYDEEREASSRERASVLLDSNICVSRLSSSSALTCIPPKDLQAVYKRLYFRDKCGLVGTFSWGKLEWQDCEGYEPVDDRVIEAVKFHPYHCRSVFCAECFEERVRSNSRRVQWFFNLLARQGITRVVFATLTIPHDGWQPQRIKELERVWQKFRRLTIGKRLVSLLEEKVRSIAQEHYAILKQQATPENAWNVVRKHLHWALRWLRENQGKTVSRALGFGLSVLEVVVRGGKQDRSLHPHKHIVATRSIPLYALRALWEHCGGGSITFIEEVSGLRRLQKYLQNYLVGVKRWNMNGIYAPSRLFGVGRGVYVGKPPPEWYVYDSYLDLQHTEPLTVEEQVELEYFLKGVRFVEFFGLRFRKPEEYQEVQVGGYQYRMMGYLPNLAGIIKRVSERLIVVYVDGSLYLCYLTGHGWMSRSQSLYRYVSRVYFKYVFGEFRSSLMEQVEAYEQLKELAKTF